MNRRLIELIREEFYNRLERKTGWGKEELKREFEQAVSQAALRFLDEQSQ